MTTPHSAGTVKISGATMPDGSIGDLWVDGGRFVPAPSGEPDRVIDADGLIAYFDAGAVSIAKRGRTSPGDKTMLDALLPAIDAMRQMRTKTADIGLLFQAAYEGALQGVEATKAMLPRKGRSKNFREKALGLPDPGAVSVSLILKGMSESVNSGAIPQF